MYSSHCSFWNGHQQSRHPESHSLWRSKGNGIVLSGNWEGRSRWTSCLLLCIMDPSWHGLQQVNNAGLLYRCSYSYNVCELPWTFRNACLLLGLCIWIERSEEKEHPFSSYHLGDYFFNIYLFTTFLSYSSGLFQQPIWYNKKHPPPPPNLPNEYVTDREKAADPQWRAHRIFRLGKLILSRITQK